MCRFDMFVLSISVLGQLLVIGLIISDSQHFKFIDMTRVCGTEPSGTARRKTSNIDSCRQYRERLATENSHLEELPGGGGWVLDLIVNLNYLIKSGHSDLFLLD